MSVDPKTIAVYDAKAGDYADHFASAQPDRHLQDFIAALPQGAHVLDLGCGPANAAAFMRAAGMKPDPVDASPGMVALANQRHAIGARLATFDDIDGGAVYDGIWANFSLLHAARGDLPRHLSAIHRALKPGGIFHIGMKTGSGAARDGIDRLYTYVTRPELLGLLAGAGFAVMDITEGSEVGLAGTDDPFILVRAHV
ncbi:MAG: class I SAM-dependent methyltransferase [Albidovulum sp.]